MAESILVTGKKISSMELVTNMTGNEKIPTGQPDDLALTPNQIADHTITRGNLASQEDLSQVEFSLGTAVGELRSDLESESSVRESQNSSLNSALIEERDARISDVLELNTSIGLESSTRQTQVGELLGQISQEREDRIAMGETKVDKEGSVQTVSGKVGDVVILTQDVKAGIDGTQQDINKYIAKPYVSGKAYSLGEKVTLDTGYVVISTEENNTGDPNSDASGWEYELSYIDAKSVSIWGNTVSNALSMHPYVNLDKDESISSSPIRTNNGQRIESNYKNIHQSTSSTPVLESISGSENISYDGVSVSQDKSDPIGGGTSNNHAMFKFNGGKNHQVLRGKLNGQYGVTFGYGAIRSGEPLYDRSTKFNLFAHNYASSIEGMYIECIGAEGTRIVGNALNSDTRGVFHGVRHTGYDIIGNPSESAHAPCHGTVGAVNTFKNVTNGFSFQNSSKFSNHAATYFSDVERVIHGAGGTSFANTPSLNRVDFTAHRAEKIIYNYDIRDSYFAFSVDASSVTSVAVEELTATSSKGFNTYSGIIKNSAFSGAQFRYSHNMYNLQVNGSALTGVIISGSYGNGSLTTDSCNSGVSVFGSNNNLRIVSTNSTVNSINISGSGNVLNIVTDGNVSIAGDNNIIIGRIGGNLTNTGTGNKIIGEVAGTVGGSGLTNDYRQIKGFVGSDQQSLTTDSSGLLTITANKHSSAVIRTCSADIFPNPNDYRVVVRSISGANITLKVLDKTGADLTSPVTVNLGLGWSN